MIESLRLAFRSLRRRPGLTAAATLTIALGIGATTTIYSVVQAALLQPLAYRRPAELVEVTSVRSGRIEPQLSFPNFRDIRAGGRAFSKLAPFRYYLFNLSGSETPESVLGVYAGVDLFPLLGIDPARGRQFLAGGDDPGQAPEVLLTDQLWRRRYGGDPALVGRIVTIDGRAVTVAGILPAGFHLGELTPTDAPLPSREPDLYVTVGSEADSHDDRGNDNYWVLGRLAPGATLERANAELRSLAEGMARRYPDHDATLELRALGLKSQIVGDSQGPLLVLLGAVGLLLFIACANVAGLLATRAADRQRETALRAALGASAWRLAGQVVAESLVLAILGGIGGVLLASWSIPAFRAAAPNTIPRLAEASLDGRVLAAALGFTLLTAVLAGLPSAMSGGRLGLAEILKEGSRGSGGVSHRRLRRSLTAAQISLSLVLLSGAGLLFRSLLRVNAVEPGFDTSRVLTMITILPQSAYPEPASWRRFGERSLAAIREVPGVEVAGAINTLPLSNLGSNTGFEVAGGPAVPPGQLPNTPYRTIAGDYFSALRIPVVAGRGFAPGDTAGAPLVALINGALARRYFPDADPVGRLIHLGNDDEGVTRTVIGVLGDTRENGLDAPPVPEVYYPFAQGPEPILSLAIRTTGDPRAVLPAVRQALAGVDPAIGFFAVRTMDELLAGTLARRRFNLEMLAGFAMAALLVSAVGLYGVIAYSASQRLREIGIRMALGAPRRAVVWLFLREGLVLAGIGAAVGLAVSLALSHVLASQLYGVGAADPVAFLGVAGVLGAVAFLAVYFPARRATRVDPVVALRSD